MHGLWSYKLEKFLDFIANNGYNAIRIPFAAELAFGLDHLKPTATAINFWENKKLEVGSTQHACHTLQVHADSKI